MEPERLWARTLLRRRYRGEENEIEILKKSEPNISKLVKMITSKAEEQGIKIYESDSQNPGYPDLNQPLEKTGPCM